MSSEINRHAEPMPWPENHREMHICPDPDCCSEMVQPEQWEEADKRGSWRLWSFCGECLTHYVGVYGDRQIDDYDEALTTYTDEVKSVLKKMERENMENFVAAFSTALETELIGPEDF